MGLGPPLCPDCELLMAYFEDPEHTPWQCLRCGSVPSDFFEAQYAETPTSLFELKEDERERYIENTKKYTEENK